MMTQKRRWLMVGLCLPLVLFLGFIGWIWFQHQEPTIEGVSLSAHLLRLNDGHADVRASALEFVKDHSDVFGPYCLRILSKQTTKVQAWVERAQRSLASTALGQKLGIRGPRNKLLVRAMTALALGVLDIPIEQKLHALNIGLHDADRQTRMESAKSLASIGPPSLQVFRPALTDTAIGVRNAAIYGVYLLGPVAKPALELLKGLLINEDQSVDPLAFEVFRQIGPDSAEVLGNALSTTNAVQKIRLLKAMVPLGRHIYPFRDYFIAGLNHVAPKVRAESARALMSAGGVHAGVAALLFPLLKDETTEVRLTALQLLNQRVPFAEPVIPDLLTLLEDDEKEIRRIAGFMLERLSPKTPESKQALNMALSSENVFVREVAQKTLANE